MDIFGTKTAVKLLRVLLDNSLKEFKEIELILISKTGKGSSGSAINYLIEKGIILEKRAGKTKLLSLNTKNSTSFLLKLLLDQEKLRKLNETQLASLFLFENSIKEELELFVIFGSTIAGTSTEESDIDILLCCTDAEKVECERKKVEELFGQRFNLHYVSKNELKTKILEDSFVQNAFLKGSVLCGYDFAKELFYKISGSRNIERLLFFHQRIKASLKNYLNKDYKTAEEIVQKTIEQLIFYVLTEKRIPYTSKKDAEKEFIKIKEGNIIKRINAASTKDKITVLEEFVINLLKTKILENEGCIIKTS